MSPNQNYFQFDSSQNIPEPLLRNICHCKGPMSYVHRSCLMKWLETKSAMRCEICLQDYKCSMKLISYRALFQTVMHDLMFYGHQRYAVLAIKYYYVFNMCSKHFWPIIYHMKDELLMFWVDWSYLVNLPEFCIKAVVIFFFHAIVYYEIERIYKYGKGLRYRCSDI